MASPGVCAPAFYSSCKQSDLTPPKTSIRLGVRSAGCALRDSEARSGEKSEAEVLAPSSDLVPAGADIDHPSFEHHLRCTQSWQLG
ncbi:hypothetical protein CapIbe_014085 [Capra ibex]